MADRDHKIVPDSMRRYTRNRVYKPQPWVTAVREGKTVFLPGANPVSIAGSRTHLWKSYQLRMRSYTGREDGVVGLYIWAVKEGDDGES